MKVSTAEILTRILILAGFLFAESSHSRDSQKGAEIPASRGGHPSRVNHFQLNLLIFILALFQIFICLITQLI
jgi:hypothetical protein